MRSSRLAPLAWAPSQRRGLSRTCEHHDDAAVRELSDEAVTVRSCTREWTEATTWALEGWIGRGWPSMQTISSVGLLL
jgi:hypothetical protein